MKLAKVERRHVQRQVVDKLAEQRLDGRTIKNAVMPLRSTFRGVLRDGEVAVNPCDDLELPESKGSRDRAASPEEAAELLAALREEDRAVWATAFYGGLRRGELRSLSWYDPETPQRGGIDLAALLIRVRVSSDDVEGEIAPKSKAGSRDVPIIEPLRLLLVEHKIRTGRSEGELVFGREADKPFTATALRRRALTDWKAENAKCEKDGRRLLKPIGLHEARHMAASWWIEAG